MRNPRLGDNAIPPVPRELLLVDKSKRRPTKIGFGGEAYRARLGCLHEGKRGGVRRQKRRRVPGRYGSKEFEKLLSGPGRKAVGRMAHNVRVNMLGEVVSGRQ